MVSPTVGCEGGGGRWREVGSVRPGPAQPGGCPSRFKPSRRLVSTVGAILGGTGHRAGTTIRKMMSALAPARATFAAAPRARARRRGARLGDPRLGSLAVAPAQQERQPRLVRRRRLLGLLTVVSVPTPISSRAGLRVGHGGQKDGRGGPRNRTGRTHGPCSTRYGRQSRRLCSLPQRAAWTSSCLTEIRRAPASSRSTWPTTPSRITTVPRQIVDVSESFILGLAAMTPVNIDEKFRNNYITVDPPALAVRL